MSELLPNNVLVALLKTPEDLDILLREGWYRIPIGSAPEIIREEQAEYIAFWQGSNFDAPHRCKIERVGTVGRITEAKREELFPTEKPGGERAGRWYYKIEIVDLQALPQPIVGAGDRKMVFLPTTSERLESARDVNDLVNDSPLEDFLYAQMQQAGIRAERQWWAHCASGARFRLDFAVFCRNGNINVECDGHAFHLEPEAVLDDKWRNNELTANDWRVLRFTTFDLRERLDWAMETLRQTMEHCGGQD